MDISNNKASAKMPLQSFADRLVPLMCRLMRHMTTQDRNYLARGLITLPQLWVLHQVAERQTCTMHMLAQTLELKSSTVTGLADRLVQLGLLKRFNSRTDRRVVLAEITPKGRAILKHLDAERHKSIIQMFRHVSPKERAVYLGIVEKILKALSAVLVAMVGAGLAAFLTGCVSAPAPSDATTPWTPPARAQNQDTVWKDIRARKADFTNDQSLAEVLDIALRNNPASRKTWSDARAASAQVDQAKGYFLPTVVGTAAAARQRTTAEPESFDLDYMKYGPGLQLNYLVINFGGGREAAVEQALQTVYAANYLFNRSIQDILLAVETAYYGLVSAKAGIEAAEANVKDARTAFETAQARKDAGVGADLEVLQARANYDQARYGLVNAKGQFKIAQGALAKAMGIPADTTLRVVAPTNAVPTALTPQDMRQLIDDALDRRPDIAALRATLAARKAAIRVTSSALWPSLYVNGNLSRDYYDTYTGALNRNTDTTAAGQYFQDNDWSYGAGATLQWTLFDGFQTLNAKRAAAAQADSAQAQLQQAELAAGADVWTRYYAYETALERHTVSIAYLASASAAYELALDSYKNGLSNIIDLLNAESQLAQARMQNVSARQEAFAALANLAYAAGRLEKGGAARTEGIFSTAVRKDQP